MVLNAFAPQSGHFNVISINSFHSNSTQNAIDQQLFGVKYAMLIICFLRTIVDMLIIRRKQ